MLPQASWLECAIDEARAEAAGGIKLPGRVGNPVAAQVVAPAVERASRSWNLGGPQPRQAFDLVPISCNRASQNQNV